jgi:hypothetical protein
MIDKRPPLSKFWPLNLTFIDVIYVQCHRLFSFVFVVSWHRCDLITFICSHVASNGGNVATY